MNGMSKKILLIIVTVCCTIFLHGQHFTVRDFKRNQTETKTTVDSVYLVETGYPATGIVLRVAKNEVFKGSFIIVNNDTLYFTEGEENAEGDLKKFSNLFTFSSPIGSFRFYPGLIKGDIEFYYINAQKETEEVSAIPSKKKRCRLFRARHD